MRTLVATADMADQAYFGWFDWAALSRAEAQAAVRRRQQQQLPCKPLRQQQPQPQPQQPLLVPCLKQPMQQQQRQLRQQQSQQHPLWEANARLVTGPASLSGRPAAGYEVHTRPPDGQGASSHRGQRAFAPCNATPPRAPANFVHHTRPTATERVLGIFRKPLARSRATPTAARAASGPSAAASAAACATTPNAGRRQPKRAQAAATAMERALQREQTILRGELASFVVMVKR